jgi:hypothetical protein
VRRAVRGHVVSRRRAEPQPTEITVEVDMKELLEDGNSGRAAMARAALTLYDGEVPK